MNQTANLDGARVAEWRANIRRDVAANYALGMALAIYRSDGAAAALPRLRDAGGMPNQETARQLLMARLLRAQGRNGEADLVERSLQEGPARRMIDGLVELIGITSLSAGLEDLTESLVEQAAALLDTALTADDRALVLAIRARQHLRQGRIEEGIADIKALCAFPVNSMPPAGVMIDILPELAGTLSRHGQNELVAALDARSLGLLYNPGLTIPTPLPQQQRILQRLARQGIPELDAVTVTEIVQRLLEKGDWTDTALLGTAGPMAVALLNRDLLPPLEQLAAFLEAGGAGAHLYRIWLLAEIIVCDPAPARHAAFLAQAAAELPEQPRLLLAVARACLCAGLPQQAEMLASRVLGQEPTQVLALSLQASLAILAEQREIVTQRCDQLRSLPLGERQAFNQQVMALLVEGAAGQALALIDKRTGDSLPLLKLLRGLALRSMNRDGDAREQVRQLALDLSDNALRRLVNLAAPVREAALLLLREAGLGERLAQHVPGISTLA
ncbi:hypothetical protein [Niveispirillum lacus]|nr:hypothetical protein [Niveispirillum lacus]